MAVRNDKLISAIRSKKKSLTNKSLKSDNDDKNEINKCTKINIETVKQTNSDHVLNSDLNTKVPVEQSIIPNSSITNSNCAAKEPTNLYPILDINMHFFMEINRLNQSKRILFVPDP